MSTLLAFLITIAIFVGLAVVAALPDPWFQIVMLSFLFIMVWVMVQHELKKP